MTHVDPTLLSRPSPQRLILLGILCAAVGTRLVAAILVGGEQFRFVDEAFYFDAAERLRSGAGYAADYTNMPGYPAFLAALGVLVPSSVLAVRMAQAVVAALGCLLCFVLGERLGGQLAGLAAAALYSLDPLLVVSAGLLYPEAVAGLLLGGALVAAWEIRRRTALTPVVSAGILLGSFTLLRPIGLALLPAMAGWVVAASERPWRQRATHVVVLIGVFVLILGPWIYRNYEVHGRALLTSHTALRGVPVIGADVVERGMPGPVATAAQQATPSFARRTLREFAHFWELYPTRLVSDDSVRRAGFARADPRLGTEPLVQRSARDLISAASFGLELALAAVGLVVCWRTRRRETVWLVAIVLSFAIGYATYYGKLRYRIPILPIVLTFAGTGAAALISRVPASHGRRSRGLERAAGSRTDPPEGRAAE